MENVNFESKLKTLALDMYKIGVLKFGDFKMKVGINSPVYCDFRIIINYPHLMDTLCDLLCELSNGIDFDKLCGVPYTALPIASIMSMKMKKPMLIRRKEQKAYGTKKLIEGLVIPNETCLIIEDVTTSGASILETVRDLNNHQIQVRHVINLLDRQQGAVDNLKTNGIQMHYLFSLSSFLNILYEAHKIDKHIIDNVQTYIANTKITNDVLAKKGLLQNDNCSIQKPLPQNRLLATFSNRLSHAKNANAKKLFNIILKKHSTLCVAADVTKVSNLIEIIENVGEHICLLKTHIDILEDFDSNQTIATIKQLANKFEFLILEDRKFADIANTSYLQFTSGIFRISEWADFITAHAICGDGMLSIIRQHNSPVGVFLLAELSCDNNLVTHEYSQSVVNMAKEYEQCVAGIVCQSSDLVENLGFLQLTPGVQMNAKSDGLDQVYNSMETVVIEKGADVCVVGRGIIKSPINEMSNVAAEYKTKLWSLYEQRTQHS